MYMLTTYMYISYDWISCKQIYHILLYVIDERIVYSQLLIVSLEEYAAHFVSVSAVDVLVSAITNIYLIYLYWSTHIIIFQIIILVYNAKLYSMLNEKILD